MIKKILEKADKMVRSTSPSRGDARTTVTYASRATTRTSKATFKKLLEKMTVRNVVNTVNRIVKMPKLTVEHHILTYQRVVDVFLENRIEMVNEMNEMNDEIEDLKAENADLERRLKECEEEDEDDEVEDDEGEMVPQLKRNMIVSSPVARKVAGDTQAQVSMSVQSRTFPEPVSTPLHQNKSLVLPYRYEHALEDKCKRISRTYYVLHYPKTLSEDELIRHYNGVLTKAESITIGEDVGRDENVVFIKYNEQRPVRGNQSFKVGATIPIGVLIDKNDTQDIARYMGTLKIKLKHPAEQVID